MTRLTNVALWPYELALDTETPGVTHTLEDIIATATTLHVDEDTYWHFTDHATHGIVGRIGLIDGHKTWHTVELDDGRKYRSMRVYFKYLSDGPLSEPRGGWIFQRLR